MGVPALAVAESLVLTGAIGSLGLPVLNSFINSNGSTITIDTTIEEVYEDTLEITEHPVELGSPIADHAFKRPMEILLRCGWSDSSIGSFVGSINNLLTGTLTNQSSGQFTGGAMAASDYVAGIYSQLLQMQQSLQPITIVSGLRVYDDMLIKVLRVRRDQRTRTALMVEAYCQQIILVSTTNVSVPPQANQANPASTAATVNAGAQQLQGGTPAPGGSFPANLMGAPN